MVYKLTATEVAGFESSSRAYTRRFGLNDNQSSVTEEERKARQATAAEGAEEYYLSVTDGYLNGWSSSFHYTPFAPNESIAQAISFLEHKLALTIGLKPGMKVLDVGCGVGGPAREIAKFIGCEIVGINIVQRNIDQAIEMTAQAGLSHLCTFVKGDFMEMPFATSSFDAAYGLEATCHASTLSKVYNEISRVLKPSAPYGIVEWVMTPSFTPSNKTHLAIRNRIERGSGISNLDTVSNARSALLAAGLSISHEEDYTQHWERNLIYPYPKDARNTISTNPSPILVPFTSGSSTALPPSRPINPYPRFPRSLPRPYYYPLAGQTKLCETKDDHALTWKMSRWPRFWHYWFVWVLERLGLAPRGWTEAMDTLAYCVDGSVEGGREGVFSPSWWFVGVKEGGVEGEERERA